jgi:prevent-host-death family protein
MRTVTIRELRNAGGKVVDRVLAGESFLVTRSGRPVAELRPVQRPGLSAERLVERWRELPPVDPAGVRDDLDSLLDQHL